MANKPRQPRQRGKYIAPNACLTSKPTPQSVLFCGYFINLSTIALHTHLTVSYISKVFRGDRTPSLKNTKLIAAALNMDLSSFVNALDRHTGLIAPYVNKLEIVEKTA
jgi:transcriptional regulator with XRE-family HTH domain